MQHWTEGHKLRCAELGAVSAGWKLYNSCTNSAAPTNSTCVVCEQGDSAGELLQQGCDCKGTAGVVHLSCLSQQASYKDVQRNLFGWAVCSTCTAEFTGKVKLGMPLKLYERHEAQHEELSARILVLSWLSSTLREHACPQAVRLDKQIVRTAKKALGVDHLCTLSCRMNLASSYVTAKQLTEGEELYRELIPVMDHVLGNENGTTQLARKYLAQTLGSQARHREAELVYRECLANGADGAFRMSVMCDCAVSLQQQGKLVGREDFLMSSYEGLCRELGCGHEETCRAAGLLIELFIEQGRAEQRANFVQAHTKALIDTIGATHPTALRFIEMSVTP